MTSNKSCQIELFTHPDRGIIEPESLYCALKAKHSVIIKSTKISYNHTIKLRLCDFHFEYMKKLEEHIDDGIKLRCIYKRNRI